MQLIGEKIGAKRPILSAPPRLALLAAQFLSLFIGDVILTPEEVDGLDGQSTRIQTTCSRQDSLQRLAGGKQIHYRDKICIRDQKALHMKTTTYLRLSLLIPILIWAICLLFFILVSASPLNELVSLQGPSAANLVVLFPAFYVFGIVIWILPYLFLAISLIILSLLVKARALITIFALSPIGMTLLTISVVNLLAIATSGNGTISSVLSTRNQDLIYFNVMIFACSLIWGYICVGIGLELYKLFQHLRMIRDEENTESPVKANQPTWIIRQLPSRKSFSSMEFVISAIIR